MTAKHGAKNFIQLKSLSNAEVQIDKLACDTCRTRCWAT